MFENKKTVKDGFTPQASDHVKVETEIKQKVNRKSGHRNRIKKYNPLEFLKKLKKKIP